MLITPIASGSTGNAYHVTDGVSSLLLDAGVPLAKIQQGCGFKTSRLAGCLVTHSHGDHIKGAKDLARIGVEVYASRGALEHKALSGHRFHPVKALESFQIPGWDILPFDVEHDAPEPLGFLIRSRATAEKLLYFTDTYYIRYKFEGLTHIMMEANYDPQSMEENVMTGRVNLARAKRTVRSHMSIDTVLLTLKALDLSCMQQIWLLHLSNDNSRADEFKRKVEELTGKEVYIC